MKKEFKSRDKVVHIEEEYDERGNPFVMEIIEVMDWGQAIVKWPSGRFWIHDTKFLKHYEPVLSEDADDILHNLEKAVRVIKHEIPQDEYSQGWNGALTTMAKIISELREGK